MATWRVARSLDTLLGQLNAKAPKRSKKSDGSIGDAAHASRSSDHNPWIKSGGMGIVTARDYSHDPAGGLDCNWLASALVASKDPRIKYVIWNRRIYTPGRGWAAYKGANPHDHHLHLSVSEQPGWFDSTVPWSLAGSSSSPITTLPAAPAPAPVQEEEDMTPDQAKKLDETHWMLSQIKPQTDRVSAVQSKVDELHWGVLDPEQGVRIQLAGIFARVGQGSGTGITPADIAAMIPADFATQVADELHKRLAG